MSDTKNKQEAFLKELVSLVNKYSRENESNTPDYILGAYLRDCIEAFEKATRRREKRRDIKKAKLISLYGVYSGSKVFGLPSLGPHLFSELASIR